MRFIKIMTLTISTVLLASASAFASSSLDNFTWTGLSASYLRHVDVSVDFNAPFLHNEVPDGQWNVSLAFSEAGHTNTWSTADGQSFSNKDAYGTGLSHVQLAGSSFYDANTNRQYSISDWYAVALYEVKNAFSVGGLDFGVGDLLIGFNDSGLDLDYDDMVLKASSATPIPGAVWLLGTGLLGLVGLRRRVRA